MKLSKRTFARLLWQEGKSKTKKQVAQLRMLQQSSQQSSMKEIQEDTLKIISDWYHFAIMELLLVKDFKSDPAWIAARLRIPEAQVSMALDRLVRMELVEFKKGHFTSTGVQLKTVSGVPSTSIRKFNKQILEKAIAAIKLQTIEVITRLLRAQNIKNNKLWIIFSKSYIIKHTFEWSHHVVPMVYLQNGENDEKFVLDTMYARRPLEIMKWTNIFMRDDEPCEKIEKFREAYLQSTGVSCFLIETSSHFKTIEDVILDGWSP